MSDEEQRLPNSLQLWWEEATGPLDAERYQSRTRAVLRRVLLWIPVAATLIVLPLLVLLAMAAHEYQWRPPPGQKAAAKVENTRNNPESLLQDPIKR